MAAKDGSNGARRASAPVGRQLEARDESRVDRVLEKSRDRDLRELCLPLFRPRTENGSVEAVREFGHRHAAGGGARVAEGFESPSSTTLTPWVSPHGHGFGLITVSIYNLLATQSFLPIVPD
jgi:hypothetical protein